MTHKSSHIIIDAASQKEFDKLPEDKREQIEAILEKANQDIEAILEG